MLPDYSSKFNHIRIDCPPSHFNNHSRAVQFKIGGDGPRSHMGSIVEYRIAHIIEMTYLAFLEHYRTFYFTTVADDCVVTDYHITTDIGTFTDLAVAADISWTFYHGAVLYYCALAYYYVLVNMD